MNKYFLLILVLFTGLSSCKKDAKFDPAKQAAADEADIKTYISVNHIDATKDPSGVYYAVLATGTGAYPTSTSTVNVNYSGELLDGTKFATGQNLNGSLTNLIKGWQYGIPHINLGGRIMLLIPSALGYGQSANGPIPANSVLIFTIDLLGIN